MHIYTSEQVGSMSKEEKTSACIEKISMSEQRLIGKLGGFSLAPIDPIDSWQDAMDIAMIYGITVNSFGAYAVVEQGLLKCLLYDNPRESIVDIFLMIPAVKIGAGTADSACTESGVGVESEKAIELKSVKLL